MHSSSSPFKQRTLSSGGGLLGGSSLLGRCGGLRGSLLGCSLVTRQWSTKEQRRGGVSAYLGGGSLLGCFLGSGLLGCFLDGGSLLGGSSSLLGRRRVLKDDISIMLNQRRESTHLLVGSGSLGLLLQLDSTTGSLGQVKDAGLGTPGDGLVQVVEVGGGPVDVVLLSQPPSQGRQRVLQRQSHDEDLLLDGRSRNTLSFSGRCDAILETGR